MMVHNLDSPPIASRCAAKSSSAARDTIAFSILICTKNSAQKIANVIRGLAAQTRKANIREVIVVDHMSRDNTVAWVQASLAASDIPFRMINSSTSGKSAALEEGLDAATGDFVAIVDDDNELYPDFLESAMQLLTGDEVGCLGSQGVVDSTLDLPAWFDKYKAHFAIGMPMQSGETDWIWGAASILRREAWCTLRANGFRFLLNPERTAHVNAIAIGGEDVELALAMKLAGYRIEYSEQLKFIHRFDQPRLNRQYLVDNSVGVARAVAVHEMYRALIYDHRGIRTTNAVWKLRFWRKVLSSTVRLAMSVLSARPSIDRQMTYATIVGMLSGYRLYAKQSAQILDRLGRLKQTAVLPGGVR